MPKRKREVIEPNSGDKRYIRRDDEGRFTQDQVEVGRSLSRDNVQRAKANTPSGHSDPGDHQKKNRIVTVDLTATEEARLAEAARKEGVEPAELLRKLVTEHLPPATEDEEPDPTLALFAQWEKEDAQRTPEEIDAEDRLWQEFEKGINETREALEMRRL